MRWLISGAAGFIGYHLAKRALREGFEVVGIDNFDPYYDPTWKHARIERLQAHPKFSLRTGNIADAATWENLANFDAFVHLAAQVGVRLAHSDESKYVESNLVGFQKACAWATQSPAMRFVYASTSNVYGANTKTPFSESDRVDAPITFYGATKRANELMAAAAHARYGRTSTGIRFFTVYGPFGRPDMAVWRFTNAIDKGEPITLFGNGELARDYTYIEDATEALWRMVLASESGASCVNIGRQSPETTQRLVKLLENHLGRAAVVHSQAEFPGEMLRTYADTSNLQSRIGFQPTTTLEDGTHAFVAWFRQVHGA